MKKLISLLLLLAMVFSLCACGSDSSAQPAATEAPAEEAAPAGPEPAIVAAELFAAGSYEEAYAILADIIEGSSVELKALCLYYGYGTEPDPEAAVELFSSLADEGSVLALAMLADASNTGNGAVQDPDYAKELYTEFVSAAEGLSADGTQQGAVFAALAGCYAGGKGTGADTAKAKSAVDKALENGNLSVFDKIELAHILEEMDRASANSAEADKPEYNADGSVKEKPDSAEMQQAKELYTQALEGIELLAEGGNVKAVKLMGDYYFAGYGGLEQDYAKAMEYYLLAANEDYAPAQAQLGLMYQDGLGVEVSYEQAMEWNNRAAQQGNAQGQAQIGYLYHMGLGVTQNLNEAGRWYSRAADQGHVWASEKLAETEITNPQLAFEFHA